MRFIKDIDKNLVNSSIIKIFKIEQCDGDKKKFILKGYGREENDVYIFGEFEFRDNARDYLDNIWDRLHD